jgi:hypothetical protein
MTIQAAFAKAMAEANSDPEKVADIIEILITSLNMAISVQGRGDPKLMGELLEGTSAYLFSRAGDFQKMGAFIAKVAE